MRLRLPQIPPEQDWHRWAIELTRSLSSQLDTDALGDTLSGDFLYKPGLGGGQTAYGGLASGEDLVLISTAHATKGRIVLENSTDGVFVDLNSNPFGATRRFMIGGDLDPTSGLIAGGIMNFIVESESALGSLFGGLSATNNSAAGGTKFFGVRAQGSLSSPSDTADGDPLFHVRGVGWANGRAAVDLGELAGDIMFMQDGSSSSNSVPGLITFFTGARSAAGLFAQMIVRHNGRVFIGTEAGPDTSTDFDARLTVRSEDTDEITTILRAAASQTANILELQDSSENVLLSFDENGLPFGTIESGTYTPTRSAETNLDSNVTMTQAQWFRVGNTITVSGRFTADPTTTATATSFEMTLPVASNIGAVEDVAGVAFCGSIASQGAEIIGVVANDTAKVQWIATDVTSQTWAFTFTYQVI